MLPERLAFPAVLAQLRRRRRKKDRLFTISLQFITLARVEYQRLLKEAS